MKKLFTTLISCVAVACLMAPAAFAQTPDGLTPANEGICDFLQADGVTKGLYGLCVAFCEAQDYASIDLPITEEEFQALADAAPSGRILANYDKKKDKANNPADPAMPCIKVEEPCPCWTSAELDLVATHAMAQTSFNCTSFVGATHANAAIIGRSRSPTRIAAVQAIDHRIDHPFINQCSFRHFNAAEGVVDFRNLARLSELEVLACRDQIVNKQVELGPPCS